MVCFGFYWTAITVLYLIHHDYFVEHNVRSSTLAKVGHEGSSQT